ncbi:MAG: DinB family protein, partial [Gemmatimonadota bacterium]
MAFDPAATFLARSRYYLGLEYPGKIRLALTAMPEDRLWHRPNASSNSVGNLVLHLAGNVRQWIVSGVGGEPDVRTRDAEFAARDGDGRDGLLAHLERACAEAVAVLDGLDPAALGEARHIQGR